MIKWNLKQNVRDENHFARKVSTLRFAIKM